MQPCIRKKVVCNLEEARSCVTLKIQMAHVGNRCVEHVRGVGLNRVKMFGLDMMSSVMWNTCEFRNLKLFETRHTCRACELVCF